MRLDIYYLEEIQVFIRHYRKIIKALLSRQVKLLTLDAAQKKADQTQQNDNNHL